MRNTQINHHVNIAGIASIFFFFFGVLNKYYLLLKKMTKNQKNEIRGTRTIYLLYSGKNHEWRRQGLSHIRAHLEILWATNLASFFISSGAPIDIGIAPKHDPSLRSLS